MESAFPGDHGAALAGGAAISWLAPPNQNGRRQVAMNVNPLFNKTSAMPDETAPLSATGPALAWRWVATVATALLLMLGLGLAVMSAVPDPRLEMQSGSQELAPDTAISFTVPRIGAGISSVALTESVLDQDGRVVGSSSIPVELVPAGETSALDLETPMALRRVDGQPLLRYDRLYLLTMTVSRKAIAFPLRDLETPQDHFFRTLTTPKVVIPEGTTELRYQSPVEVRWTSPVKGFSVDLTPPVDYRVRLSPDTPSVGYVDLVGAKMGKEYSIRITEGVGANGAPLLSDGTISVRTAAPPMPRTEGVRLEDGNLAILPWDRAVTGLKYEVEPAVQTSIESDPANPLATGIRLLGASLATEYTVTVSGAVADNGAPLMERAQFKVTTPRPLEISKFRPKHGSANVETDAPIEVAFSEPIKDRAAAEKAIIIQPAVNGHFEWPEPNLVRFVPTEKFPLDTDVSVHFGAGPGGLRGENGGYLVSSDQFAFKTFPRKSIDIDLTRQRITLLEAGEPVLSSLVSTGVRGAETPTGMFNVEYKLTKTRMRGVNPSGRAYDLPDVPWVMPFLGDYAIHGAYWREVYGTPQSNGCVSMPPGVAKQVYDWTPVGTPVLIHY